MNEDRFILSAAKCRPMILVSRNIKYYADIRGGSSGSFINCHTTKWSCSVSVTFNINIMFLTFYGVNMCHVARPIGPYRQERYYVSLNEKTKRVYFSAKWAQKCRIFNSTITMKLIIPHAQHISLHSILCRPTISAFWTVADVYNADNVSQIMNLKAKYR